MDLKQYIDLGIVPLANNLIPKNELNKKEQKFPLQVAFCTNCFLSQLTIVVDPKILFSHYRYQSSISQTFINHCAKMATSFKNKFNLKNNDLIVDIASNDGCLLKEFKKVGTKVVGVEPASNLAQITEKSGIPTVCDFWFLKTAEKIREEYGNATIITATNVFAHVDDLNEFVKAVDVLLTEDGIFVIEVPYLVDLLENTEFDTIYHEHLSYFLVNPLIVLFKKHQMEIFDIEKFEIHGGTIRVYVKKRTNNKIPINNNSINKFLNLEKKLKLDDFSSYQEFSKKIELIKNNINNLINHIKNENKTIVGYGASAKGNTLMNYCGITDKDLLFIVDDTPEKQGFYSPGTKIPIVNAEQLKKQTPDYILILAWNFAKEIIEKTKWFKDQGGMFIVPISEVKVI